MSYIGECTARAEGGVCDLLSAEEYMRTTSSTAGAVYAVAAAADADADAAAAATAASSSKLRFE